MSLLLLLSGGHEFHPEVLHRHIRQLEQVYDPIPESETNGRTAVAMAIVAATASFVEGSIHQLLRQHLLAKIGDGVLVDDVLGHFRGLERKLGYAKKRVELLGGKWQVKDDGVSQFVENRLGPKTPGLIGLRNLIDHGTKITKSHLRLEDVKFFRQTACKYLEQVYSSYGDMKPAWLGI
jgi:hypothetical protein